MKDSEMIDLTGCELKDVKQHVHPNGSIMIAFTMKNCRFELEVEYVKNELAYRKIYHSDQNEERKCPFCSYHSITCQGLTRQTEQVFEKLIHRPEIRLYWVTKKHLIKKNNQ